jgi:hypothetical protein
MVAGPEQLFEVLLGLGLSMVSLKEPLTTV